MGIIFLFFVPFRWRKIKRISQNKAPFLYDKNLSLQVMMIKPLLDFECKCGTNVCSNFKSSSRVFQNNFGHRFETLRSFLPRFLKKSPRQSAIFALLYAVMDFCSIAK